MPHEEIVTLRFSVAEKQAFLERHGYTVERRHIEKEENYYQNKFRQVLSIETTATKGEYKDQLHIAFLHELKAQLLKL